MRKQVWRVSTLILLPLLALQLSGCTVLGLAIGNRIDKHEIQYPQATPQTLAALEPGSQVEIMLRDGRLVQGHWLYYSPADSSLVVQEPDRLATEEIGYSPQLKTNETSYSDRDLRKGETRFVSLGEVALLTLQEKGKTGRIVGGLLGAGVDTAVLVALAHSMDFGFSGGGEDWFGFPGN